jgi:hypothetical protein
MYDNSSVLGCDVGFPFFWKNVWRTKVSLRAPFFSWSVALEKILTMDNLRKRHIIVVDCIIHVKGIESPWTIFYFIVRLPVPCGMFSSIDLGCPGVMPRRVINLYVCWWTASTRSVVVWKDDVFVSFVVSLEGNE